MRIATAVIVALALLTAPATAQFGGGGKHNRGGDDKKSEAKTPKVDEKAYKADSNAYRSPRKNTIHGELHGLPIQPRRRNNRRLSRP